MEKQLQRSLQKLLDDLVVNRKLDRGIQAAVCHGGKIAASACSGFRDAEEKFPVSNSTLFPVFSVTKGVTATLVHIAASKGFLDYDTPLAEYWPEFGINGKERITMRMVLAHTAGLPQLPVCQDLRELTDWNCMCRRIAAEKPLWEPGTQSHYHAISFAYLTMEPLRRVTGLNFNELCCKYLFYILGNCDCYCGMTDEQAAVSPIAVIEANPNPAPVAPNAKNADSVAALAIPEWVRPLENWINRPEIRKCELSGSTGIMSAEFLALMYGALVDNRLLTPQHLAFSASPIHQGAVPLTERGSFALGYHCMFDPEHPGRIFGHGGYGGSCGCASLDGNWSLAVFKNRMGASNAFREVFELVRGYFA